MNTPDSYSSGAPNGKRQLNVVFHGLWAWEVQSNRILAHTPIEEDHEIVVGDFSEQTPIPAGTHCVLSGVDAGHANAFVPQQNVVVGNRPFTDVSKRHCVVELPLPQDIRSVRRVHVGTKHPFSGRDGAKLHPTEVTMVQVLIYEFDCLGGVALTPLRPEIRINPDYHTANLHFFAQPPGGHHGSDDFKKAYENMAAMFGLDISPVEALFVNATVDPGIAGMTVDDLRLLGEMVHAAPAPSPAPAPHPHGRSGPGFALPHLLDVSGSNCDGLVIDNSVASRSPQHGI